MSRNFKKVFLLLALLTVVSALAVSAFTVMAEGADAQGSCGKDVSWAYADGTLTVSGNGAMNGYTATTQPWKQYASEITSVVIGEGVTSVGLCAFYGFNAITEVTLPESLTAIDPYAFFSCKGLNAITVPEGVAFIGQYAFRKSGLTAITFADGEGWTFADGTALTAENTVSAFKSGATYKTDCAKLVKGTGAIVASGKFYGNVFAWTLDDNGALTVSGEGKMPKLSATTTPWNQYTASVRSVVIEEGITSIARCSFYGCKALTSVTLPESVEAIGEYAFYGCSSIVSVKIPAAVTEIGKYAFRRCSSLSTVEFGAADGWNFAATANSLVRENYTSVWTRTVINAPADGGESLYADIVAEFKKMALDYQNGTPASALTGTEALVTVFGEYAASENETALGYAMKDINGDGYLELFIMAHDCHVYAAYTIADGAPVLLGTFFQGNGHVTPYGEIYYYDKTFDDAGKQLSVSYNVTEVVGGKLVGIEFGRYDADGNYDTTDDVYYIVENGVKTEVEKAEYNVYSNHYYEYYVSYPTRLTKLVGLTFVPAVPYETQPDKSADFSTYDGIIDTFGYMYNTVSMTGTKPKFDRNTWIDGAYDNGMIFTSDADYQIYNRLFGAVVYMQGSSSSSKYGYAMKDLDGNGVDELILMDQYGSGTSMRHDIFAIFTQVNGKAVLLDVYNDNHYAAMDANGNIYVVDRVIPGHKKDFTYTVYTVDGDKLVATASYGCVCDTATTSTQIGWYKLSGGVKTEVTQDEYNEFYNGTFKPVASTASAANYGKYNAKNAGLTFTQI